MGKRYYLAVVETLEDGTQKQISRSGRCSISTVRQRTRVPVRPGFRYKIWEVGDTESEDVYREQGWFPD
jgi:hypothetical protein